ncbi:MAG: hypothetical protein NTV05_15765 [Acidobacteria bacterium]|nr:hypothetical protein [Acidobacteriota bacterium]
MILPILLLFSLIVLVVHFLGLQRYGREAWAPIAVPAAIAMVTAGTVSSAWLTYRGFAESARNPPVGTLAAVQAVKDFLAQAQEADLILATVAAMMATSTLLTRLRTDDVTPRLAGGVWRSVVLWVAAISLIIASLLIVVDAVQVRYFVNALESRSRGDAMDAMAVSQMAAAMLVVMLLCGVVVTVGSGLATIVGFFATRRDRASRVQSTAARVLLWILTIYLCAASVGHILSLWDLRRVPERRLGGVSVQEPPNNALHPTSAGGIVSAGG